MRPNDFVFVCLSVAYVSALFFVVVFFFFPLALSYLPYLDFVNGHVVAGASEVNVKSVVRSYIYF